MPRGPNRHGVETRTDGGLGRRPTEGDDGVAMDKEHVVRSTQPIDGDDVPTPSDAYVPPLERDRGDRETPEAGETGTGPFGADAEPSLMMRIGAAPEEVIGDATEEGHAREPQTGGRTDARVATEGREALDTDRPHTTRAERETETGV